MCNIKDSFEAYLGLRDRWAQRALLQWQDARWAQVLIGTGAPIRHPRALHTYPSRSTQS